MGIFKHVNTNINKNTNTNTKNTKIEMQIHTQILNGNWKLADYHKLRSIKQFALKLENYKNQFNFAVIFFFLKEKTKSSSYLSRRHLYSTHKIHNQTAQNCLTMLLNFYSNLLFCVDFKRSLYFL